MTREQLDAIHAQYATEPPHHIVRALLAEVERLRDVLAAVAAPLSPSAYDLWAGVDMARNAIGGRR